MPWQSKRDWKPLEERSCTDIPWLIIFTLFCIGMVSFQSNVRVAILLGPPSWNECGLKQKLCNKPYIHEGYNIFYYVVETFLGSFWGTEVCLAVVLHCDDQLG